MSPSNIVKPEHLTQINAALDQIARVRAELDLATRAGMDTAALKSKLDASENRLRQQKQVYFPGQ